MQDKFEFFDNLLAEIQYKTAQALSTRDLLSLSQTSKRYFTLFKSISDVHKLLHYVVRSEYDLVKEILNQDMKLLFKRGRVTDCSGRIFENISSFEYVLWAMDKHMWTWMLGCLPQNKEGREVVTELLNQYRQVKAEGVTYSLNDVAVTEKHFDFEGTIIKELKIQVDFFNGAEPVNGAEADEQWRTGVGGAQKLLPMHAINEYCSKTKFYPMTDFTNLVISASKHFFSWLTNKKEDWFAKDSKLGIDFAVHMVMGGMRGARPKLSRYDLASMIALYEARTKDFITLESNLEKQMTVDVDDSKWTNSAANR